MIEQIVNRTWKELVQEIIKKSDRFSSEKSIVFDFAWKLKCELKDSILLDFEKRIYENFSDGQFLDLYFEYEGAKVGIEFKYPKGTKNNSEKKGNTGNSNQTQTRIKIINDIKRLSYLVNTEKIDYGVFLMITNEKPYIFAGNKNVSNEFRTYLNTLYSIGQLFPKDEKSSREEVICPTDIGFKWNGIESNNLLYHVAWVDPIILHKNHTLHTSH
ncbi:hypothetical protein AAEO56_13585 [Flavobacterium sp. DGU11]|uniref:Restriction endonuclease n=1 Tax=Flavobacterium arundinis TaxID=3139143 RepID=A0ABU9I028_9FLAO